MRFVFAIVAFVVAAVMIAVGIAQRTLFVTPEKLTSSISNDNGARYLVIDGSALTAHPGPQTFEISGDSAVFLAYGRTADVKAWLDTQPYASIGQSQLAGQVKTSNSTMTGTSTSAPAPPSGGVTSAPAVSSPNPTGSDLWLEQFTGSKSLTTSIIVPASHSVIIASDGTAPAPSSVKLSWPLNNSTPWAGPLIVGGGLILLIGLGLYLWGLLHIRRSRGPRRSNPPKMPKPPAVGRFKASQQSKVVSVSRGRRSAGRSRFAAIPVIIASALALSGCATNVWAESGPAAPPGSAPSSRATDNPAATDNAPAPAVTVRQLENIVGKVSSVAAEADANLNATTLGTRFGGSALELRKANYAIRGKVPDFAAPQPIPSSPLTLTLPQATGTWPRTAFVIVKNEAAANQPPTLLALTQKTPRDNYLVQYAVALKPGSTIPQVAPANVGTSIVAPDSRLLLLPPNQIAAAYGDVLAKGPASQFASIFEEMGDSLRANAGLDFKNKRQAEKPANSSIDNSLAPVVEQTLALSTITSGALVAVDLREIESVKPTQPGSTIEPTGAVKALSGIGVTAKGINSTYDYQLLLFVPPVGSNQKIEVLGFSQGLIASSEVP